MQDRLTVTDMIEFSNWSWTRGNTKYWLLQPRPTRKARKAIQEINLSLQIDFQPSELFCGDDINGGYFIPSILDSKHSQKRYLHQSTLPAPVSFPPLNLQRSTNCIRCSYQMYLVEAEAPNHGEDEDDDDDDDDDERLHQTLC
jgi:hypothetical protein